MAMVAVIAVIAMIMVFVVVILVMLVATRADVMVLTLLHFEIALSKVTV
jgi:hypothetical protein